MSKIAIITDSNSGISQREAEDLGIFVLPMPFTIDGETFFEDINFTHEQFYEKLMSGADILTSQPAVGDVLDLWEKVLTDYDEIVHIPMSSSLSSEYQTAKMLSEDYDKKIFVVNNQRISVTQKHSVFQAIELSKRGKTAEEIKSFLEETKFDSSIYITLETLKYLKKGGRITPAAATLGELLKIKPVLQIQGGKLDAFTKARTKKQAKKMMINAVKDDFEKRFNTSQTGENMAIFIAYSHEKSEALEFMEEVKEAFPNHNIMLDPLSLSVACHIGPGAIALACAKKI